MARIIDITLKLSDQLSSKLKATVNSATASLGKLQDRMNQPIRTPQVQGASGIGVGAIVQGNLIADAISSVASGVLSAGQALAGSIASAYTDAAEISAGSLSATAANAALLGMNFKQSAELTRQISSELAKSAEALPGATKDYMQAFQGVSDTLSLSGGLTKSGLTADGKAMVELTAMLGQASGAGSGATSTVLGKMLGDTGSEALFRIDAFEKVPAFKAILEADLLKAGKTLEDFFNMDAAAKQKALVAVKEKLFSDDYVAGMNASMDNQFEVLKSKLFDPTVGVFGFLRDVNLAGDPKATNVFTELGTAFKSFTALATTTLAVFGEGDDPMQQLAQSIRNANQWFTNANRSLQALTTQGISDISGIVGGIQSSLGNMITGAVTSYGQALRSAIGQVMGTIVPALQSGGMGDLGFTVATKLGEGLRFVMATLSAYLYDNAGTIALLAGTALAALGQVTVGLLFGLANQLPGLLGSALRLGFEAIAAGASMVLAGGVGLVTGIVTGWFQQSSAAMQRVGSAMVSALGGIAALATSGFATVRDTVGGMISAVRNGISSIGSALSSAFSSIQSTISGMLSNIPVVGSSLPKATARYMGNLSEFGYVSHAAEGNLLEAVQQEQRSKPTGSHLVIANSSELIVPRDHISQVTGSSFNFTIQATTINQVVDQVRNNLQAASRQGAISMV
jgi:hypothetical protein